MGVFNLNREPEQKNQEPEAQPVKPVVNEPAPGEVKTDDSAKQKTIVMDGPLSKCYTQALNIVYAKQNIANVSQETSAIDSTIVMNLQNQNAKEKAASLQENKDALYVYVTDTKSLDGHGLTDAFDNVRIALSDQPERNKIVCIETDKRVSNNQIVLENYLLENNVKVAHSRRLMLKMIRDN